MLERQLATKFRREFIKLFPDAFYYKIPDARGLGGQRPFDVVALVSCRFFAIEFKRGSKNVATPYQYHNLLIAERNGASIFVVNEDNWRYKLDQIEEMINGNKP